MISERRTMDEKTICAGCGIYCDPKDSLCLKCHDSMMETDAWQLKTSMSDKTNTEAFRGPHFCKVSMLS